LNKKIHIAVSLALYASLPALAEQTQLPTLVIEDNTTRPGTFSAAPDASGLKDAASLLNRVPGANVNRSGPLTGIAQYRGMYGNRVNISVDGASIKEAGPNSMDPPLSHLATPLIESLQVHRGIAPISSGMESIGGSMKATMKKGEFADPGEYTTNGSAALGYSSVEDGRFGSLFLSGANEHHKIYISGTSEKGRDYKFKGDKKVFPSRYDRDSFTGGYGYQRDGHEFGLNYSGVDTGHTGTPALPMDILFIRGGLANADYSWQIDAEHKMSAYFFYQNMRHEMSNFHMRNAPTLVADPMAGKKRYRKNHAEVEGGGLNLTYTMPLGSGDLMLGFNGDQSYHRSLITDPIMNSAFFINNFKGVYRDRYSPFAEWSGKLDDRWNAELGVRYMHVDSNAGNVDFNGLPSMATVAATRLRNQFNNAKRSKQVDDVDLTAIFRYELSSDMDIEIGFARKNRAPSYQERYLWIPLESTAGLADGRNYIGNIDLGHETAYQAELGFDWHGGDIYFAPRAFYHYVHDYIQGLPTSNQTAQMLSNGMRAMVGQAPTTVLEFSNINAQLYGVDVEAGYTFTDWLRIDAGLNYVRGERTDGGGGNLYRIAPLNGRAQLTFEHSGFMAALEGIFYARQNQVATYNNEKETPGYSIMNVRLSYEPFDGLVMGTGVENVFDTEHFNHLGGYSRVSNVTSPDVTRGGRIPLPGRNVYATLSYSW